MTVSIAAHVAREICALPYDGKGVECRFYRLSDTIGFKFYDDERVARNTFCTQAYYHHFGLAPACWDLGEIVVCGKVYSGYFTEVVTPIIDIYNATQMAKPSRKISAAFDNWIYDIASELCCELNRINPAFDFSADMHSGNFGIDSNGNIVVIDMSHTSFNGSFMCYDLVDFKNQLDISP